MIDYQYSKNDVQFEIKDLIQIIEKTIDREHEDERHNLTKGRLQKTLLIGLLMINLSYFTKTGFKQDFRCNIYITHRCISEYAR